MSRDRQHRTVRDLRFWVASMAPLVGSMAEELKDSELTELSTCRRGPLGIDLRLVWSALNACFNVDAQASPAQGGRICMLAARSVGFKLNGERERACRAIPSIPSWDPISKSVM